MDSEQRKQIRDSEQRQRLRSRAMGVKVTVHVGKGGVTEGVIAEMREQLKREKLVKVKILPTAREEGVQGVAERLAEATGSELVEIRGGTAVFYKR